MLLFGGELPLTRRGVTPRLPVRVGHEEGAGREDKVRYGTDETDPDCCARYACFPYSSPPVCAPSCATDLDCTDDRTCCVAFRPDFPFCDYVCLPS